MPRRQAEQSATWSYAMALSPGADGFQIVAKEIRPGRDSMRIFRLAFGVGKYGVDVVAH